MDQKVEDREIEPEIEPEVEPESLSAEEIPDPAGLDVQAGTGITPYDPLKRYLLEIRRFAPLTREEEHALAVLYHTSGDRAAAYRLVTSNLKLVVKIAMIYRKVYRNIMDLIQEGNLGLLMA